MVDSRWIDDRPNEFEVSAESIEQTSDNEGANTCRLAVISSLLSPDSGVLADVTEALKDLGFSDRFREQIGFYGNEYRGRDRNDSLGAALTELRAPDVRDDQVGSGGIRDRLWIQVNDANPRPATLLAFGITGLQSELERESLAGALLLWHEAQDVLQGIRPHPMMLEDLWFDLYRRGPRSWPWPYGFGFFGLDFDDVFSSRDIFDWDGSSWRRVAVRLLDRGSVEYLAITVMLRIQMALRSSDPYVRHLAALVLDQAPDTPYSSEPSESPPTPPLHGAPGGLVSTMIHGTFAWDGDWWTKDGEFHQFVRTEVRPDLYNLGAPFSWSGKLKEAHRKKAATRFGDWAEAINPNGLRTVFGHSYGGEIAVRASLRGAAIGELVLLSTPVTNPVIELAEDGFAIADIRLRFDIALLLAQGRRGRQQIPHRKSGPDNVRRVVVKRWFWSHVATHDVKLWQQEDLVKKAELHP